MRWGIVGEHGGIFVNARSETVDEKPPFRDAVHAQRCVVFADSHYEWTSDVHATWPFRFTIDAGMTFTFAAL